MSNLKSVWKRKSTQRFHTANQPHELGALFKVQTANGSQLDKLGEMLRWGRFHIATDEEYRRDLMTRIRVRLNEYTEHWERGEDFRRATLEMIGKALGINITKWSGMGDGALHAELCKIVFDWFSARDFP